MIFHFAEEKITSLFILIWIVKRLKIKWKWRAASCSRNCCKYPKFYDKYLPDGSLCFLMLRTKHTRKYLQQKSFIFFALSNYIDRKISWNHVNTEEKVDESLFDLYLDQFGTNRLKYQIGAQLKCCKLSPYYLKSWCEVLLCEKSSSLFFSSLFPRFSHQFKYSWQLQKHADLIGHIWIGERNEFEGCEWKA